MLPPLKVVITMEEDACSRREESVASDSGKGEIKDSGCVTAGQSS